MDPEFERARQSQVMSKAKNVLNAQLFRNGHGPISAPIVDNHPFNGIYARKGSRECSESNRERGFFAKAGDLDDYFQTVSSILRSIL
jgi:hypothetical protein